MNITNLDTKKYKRFFAFGCSSTNYIWPTWADIIGEEIPYYENWGQSGAGNQFIFNSVIECDLRHSLNEDDLVIIMWTSCSREDRYVDDEWLFTTLKYIDNNWLLSIIEKTHQLKRSVVNELKNKEQVYGKEWMKKFANQGKGLMIRDFASIYAIQKFLNNTRCDWVNLNSLPLVIFDTRKIEKDGLAKKISFPEVQNRWVYQQKMLSKGSSYRDEYLDGQEVIDLYQDLFPLIKSPLFEKVLDNKIRPNFNDWHATPTQSLNYLNEVLPNNLSANEFVEKWGKIVWSIEEKNIMPIPFTRKIINRF
jgi:hypothetical protein